MPETIPRFATQGHPATLAPQSNYNIGSAKTPPPPKYSKRFTTLPTHEHPHLTPLGSPESALGGRVQSDPPNPPQKHPTGCRPATPATRSRLLSGPVSRRLIPSPESHPKAASYRRRSAPSASSGWSTSAAYVSAAIVARPNSLTLSQPTPWFLGNCCSHTIKPGSADADDSFSPDLIPEHPTGSPPQTPLRMQ